MSEPAATRVAERIGRRNVLAGVVVVGLALARLYLELHTPLVLMPQAGHDDGLFIRLAGSLAGGRWLGAFNQYTLMKGAGYPLFVAASGQLGLPLSLSHALLHITAAAAAGWALLRLSGNGAAALGLYTLILVLPAGFNPELQRVLRDQIYWAQTLLAVSTAAVALLAAPEAGRRPAALAVGSGVLLGWTWITREEGLWLVPGFLVLASGALLHGIREARDPRSTLGALVGMCGGGIVVLAAVAGLNYLSYRTFALNDFQAPAFKAAVSALQSIETGAHLERVPVSDRALELAARTSPAFAPMAVPLRRGGPLQSWRDITCQAVPSACGEIGGGWFMWALRDAAQIAGAYGSAADAASRFSAVAEQIKAACADGRLTCRTSIDAFLPPMSPEQWRAMPLRFARAASLAALLDTPSPMPAKGPDLPLPVVERVWSFLNYPRIITPGGIEGWRLTGQVSDPQGGAWPRILVLSAAGEAVTAPARRDMKPTPPVADIPAPLTDTFVLAAACADDCTLEVAFADGRTVRLPFGPGAQAKAVELGSARVTINIVHPLEHPGALSNRNVTSARNAVAALSTAFRYAYAPFLALSLMAFCIALGRAVSARRVSPVLVLAATAWTLVASRLAVVTLVDVSAFPAVNVPYLVPATYLAALAAVASLTALRGQRAAPQTTDTAPGEAPARARH